jgi:glycerophosphoryl diester phosphodiesterase
MRIAAQRGNALHAPENTRPALLCAYTAGADAMQFEVRLTGDGHVVLASDDATDALTGEAGRISELTLAELRKLDFSKTYRPRGSPGFAYRPPGRAPLRIETLGRILDELPADLDLLIELPTETSPNDLADKVADILVQRGREDRTVVYSADGDLLGKVHRLAPAVRVLASNPQLGTDAQLKAMEETAADGLVTDVSNVIDGDGQLTDLGRHLEELHAAGKLAVGAVLSPGRQPAVFTQAEYEALRQQAFVWSLSTTSLFDVAAFTRPGEKWVDASIAGTKIDTTLFAFGYAKANRYCHVFQDDGVHVNIEPYDGPATASDDPVQRRLQQLEERTWYALKDWPFYSGGGFGLIPGIRGDFAAEVDFAAQVATQATMCEMAVVNADPGTHHPPWNDDHSPRVPATFRDKDIFFDPHGAPPFVGSEHDEDDGYRINWNLGTDYDTNQYGPPVGDGKVLAGRLRLERRGPYFASYYRNDTDATDWVCTGVTRNDSMNPTVYLRCAGKRWRQETEEDPSKFFPIVANEFVFRNLTVTRFLSPAGDH